MNNFDFILTIKAEEKNLKNISFTKIKITKNPFKRL